MFSHSSGKKGEIMKKSSSNHFLKIIYVFILALLLSACQTVYKLPAQPVLGYPKSEKINLNVNLILSDELCKTEWQYWDVITYTIPLGDAICQNAEVVTRELFSTVAIKNHVPVSKETEVGATLIPRVISFEMPWVQGIWNYTIITVIFEWTLKDSNDNIIWVDTITAEGIEKGGLHREPTERRIKDLIDDLFHNSFQAISTSPEIKDFAMHYRKP